MSDSLPFQVIADKRPWISQDPHMEDRGIFTEGDEKFYVDFHCGQATCTVRIGDCPHPDVPGVTVVREEVFTGRDGRSVAHAALMRWKELNACTVRPKKETT